MDTPKKIDRLSALIQRFRVDAKVLQPGPSDDASTPHSGTANLFLIRTGKIRGIEVDGTPPLLVFFPHGAPSDFHIEGNSDPAQYVSASVDTGGDANPIALALPEVLSVSLADFQPLKAVTDLLLEEALAPRCGGGAVIDRLCEVVVIRLLRHLIETGETKVGLVAGLAHPNLSLAVVAVHDAPQNTWRLEDMAHTAGMSRTHFANTFRDVMGVTPGVYLSHWRLALARTEITKGTPLKVIARKVGFSSSASLSRAFTRRYGVSPSQDYGQLAS